MKPPPAQEESSLSGDGKPSLLVTTTTLPRFEGDPEPRFVLDLSKSLSRYFDVTILAPASPGAALRETMEGVDVVRYRYAPLRAWETLAAPGAILSNLKSRRMRTLLVPFLVLGLVRGVLRILSRKRFACVHCHWILPQGIVQAILPTGKRSPRFVVTAHGADVYALTSRPVAHLKRYVLRKAVLVTAVSQEIQSELSTLLGSPGECGKIVHIPMGVDLVRFTRRPMPGGGPTPNTVRGRIRILFVGRLAAKKGLAYLLDALASEPLARDPSSAIIVGDGPLRRDLQRRCETLRIEDRVEFLGAKSHQELPDIYGSADIFCAPSVTTDSGDREGLPTVLLEAAASGLPLVATNVGGIGEIVRDQVTGLLVPERDPGALSEALHLLVRNEGLRVRYGEAAWQASRAFGWPAIGDRYAEVLRRCAEEAHG